MGKKHDKCSPRRTLVGIALLVVAMLGIFVGMSLFKPSLGGYPKKSPFAAVRWQDSQPEVKVGDEWFKLISLNDIFSVDIVAFSQRTYGNLWQKRFEEDLVELLTLMGHPPQNTVKLVVQSLSSHQTRTLDDIPMTKANRRAIRDAAEARERRAQLPATQSGAAIDDADAALTGFISRGTLGIVERVVVRRCLPRSFGPARCSESVQCSHLAPRDDFPLAEQADYTFSAKCPTTDAIHRFDNGSRRDRLCGQRDTDRSDNLPWANLAKSNYG
jgi:hypothetical protein